MKNSKLKMTLKVKRTLEMKGASKKNTSLAAPGYSLNACTAALPAKSKMASNWPQNGQRVWKGVYPLVLGTAFKFR